MRKKNKIENPEQQFIGACTICGKFIKENEEIIKNNKYICRNCIIELEKQEEKPKEDFNFIPPAGVIKIIIYFLSFINPAIGFIFGAIFYSQKSNENKNFGKKCFFLMAAGIVFYLMLFIIFSAIGSGIMGNISDFQFNEGYY